MTQQTNRERYEEYCQAKRDIDEIPFTFDNWLDIDRQSEVEKLIHDRGV